MSLALVIVRPDAPAELLEGGEALLDALEDLDQAAAEAGLRAPGDFGDSREIPEDFDGDLDDLRELMGPSTEWFDAAEAAAEFEALAPEVAGAPDLVAALTELAGKLRATPGPFRLDIV